MLLIREKQLQILSAAVMQQMCAQLRQHVRRHFKHKTDDISDTDLEKHLIHCVESAHKMGLTTSRDIYRYVNLAAEYGWDFQSDVNLKWMQDYLLDSDVSDISERLLRLTEKCIKREELLHQSVGKKIEDKGSNALMDAEKNDLSMNTREQSGNLFTPKHDSSSDTSIGLLSKPRRAVTACASQYARSTVNRSATLHLPWVDDAPSLLMNKSCKLNKRLSNELD